MAHTKAGSTTRLGRESEAKRLGIKLFDGEKARAGMVLVRQRGSKWLAGKNVRKGGDDTLYAGKDGTIKFTKKTRVRFDNSRKTFKVVNVI
ncbi:MAG: 50S ribosomal protein L27 [Parcubacteria group bacterium GW2011_GWA2_39_18]|nr:MAG: 50S ribosomal protein L27 [Parcubacteria group bacterium GW2011_GWA2_39_18]